jgi:hypothetical protein
MFEFLTTTLGAAIKSLATKAVTGPVEGMARKALKRVDEQPIDQATAAVQKAVEAARRDLVNDYWAGEDELSRDVVRLLRHPPFAETVAAGDLHRSRRAAPGSRRSPRPAAARQPAAGGAQPPGREPAGDRRGQP